MPHINKKITADNWPFKPLELTETDYAWLKQNPHQKIYRLKYLSPSTNTANLYYQTDIASLKDELQVISSDSCLISFDIVDLYSICQPDTHLIYVPCLTLQLSEQLLQSTANIYQVRSMISLYSVTPFTMMEEFVDSEELIKKHIKANTYRSGTRIITDCYSACSLLLVLED